MSRSAIILLAVGVLSLAVGLVGHSAPIIDGLGKALFGVCIIGVFIIQFFGQERA